MSLTSALASLRRNTAIAALTVGAATACSGGGTTAPGCTSNCNPPPTKGTITIGAPSVSSASSTLGSPISISDQASVTSPGSIDSLVYRVNGNRVGVSGNGGSVQYIAPAAASYTATVDAYGSNVVSSPVSSAATAFTVTPPAVTARDTSFTIDEAQNASVNLAGLVSPAGGTFALGTPSNAAFVPALQGTTANITDPTGDANGSVTIPFTYTVSGQSKTGNINMTVTAEPDVTFKSDDLDARLAGLSYIATINGTDKTITPAGTKVQMKTGVNTIAIKTGQAGFYDVASFVFPAGEYPLSGLGQKTWSVTLPSSDVAARVSHFRTDNADIVPQAMAAFRIAYMPVAATPDSVHVIIETGAINSPGGAVCTDAPAGWATNTMLPKVQAQIAADLKPGRKYFVETKNDPSVLQFPTVSGGVGFTTTTNPNKFIVCYNSTMFGGSSQPIMDSANPGYMKGALVRFGNIPSTSEIYGIEFGGAEDGGIMGDLDNNNRAPYTRQGGDSRSDVRPAAEQNFVPIVHRIGSAFVKLGNTFARPKW